MADNNVVHICRRCIHGSHYPNRSACYTLGITPVLDSCVIVPIKKKKNDLYYR